MSSEDANDYLDEMTQSNSQNVNEFRIMTVSMEKVRNLSLCPFYSILLVVLDGYRFFLKSKPKSKVVKWVDSKSTLSIVFRCAPVCLSLSLQTLIVCFFLMLLQPSARQCENAEVVAGKGDRNKGVQALEGVSIPMFSAEGLAIKRANGEVR